MRIRDWCELICPLEREDLDSDWCRLSVPGALSCKVSHPEGQGSLEDSLRGRAQVIATACQAPSFLGVGEPVKGFEQGTTLISHLDANPLVSVQRITGRGGR